MSRGIPLRIFSDTWITQTPLELTLRLPNHMAVIAEGNLGAGHLAISVVVDHDFYPP